MAKQKDIDAIREFMKEVERTFAGGIATEHTYRPVLKILLDRLGAGEVYAMNEPKRIECGAPDLALMRKDIAIGYLEAKDIDKSLRDFNEANQLQFDRYTENLDNLVYTNCLDWDFYRDGNLVHSVSVAKLNNKKIVSNPEAFSELVIHLQEFLSQSPQTINTAKALTSYMAKRTRIIRHAFEKGLSGDNPVKSLKKQYKTVVKELISGLSEEEFADMYAQTVTYGLFAAWLVNKTPDKFNRQEIDELLPEDYPFLKNLFEFITAKTPDKGLEWAIDDLIAVYRAANLEKIKTSYSKSSKNADIFIHFYENFLQKYDSDKRKTAGVYYTPDDVVDFIVRGVDWVLINKLNVSHGLANSEKIGVKWKTDKVGDLKDENVHKVQILDPATGTGTFLTQTIRQIAKSVKASTKGKWSSYVDKDLLPRLHGLEILMAPYTMAYLKLDRVLKELEYKRTVARPKRMSVYLTNSLTEANKDISELGYNEWLEEEARGASNIKSNYPIMCVIGNPPYSVRSQNMGPSAKWIRGLVEEYRYVDGKHFGEKKSWLQDDYIKFVRLAQYKVEKNKEGVVGMITNHGYLEGPTFRGMRWHLMNSFDEIYILDLHGSERQGFITPDGKPDENIFGITIGVSIIIAWRKKRADGAKKSLAKVFHGDLWGKKNAKFKNLQTANLDSKTFQQITPCKPFYLFDLKNYDLKDEYYKGFKITEFMPENSVGVMTARDGLTINFNKTTLWEKINDFAKMDTNKAREKYRLGEDSRDWNLLRAQADVKKELSKKNLKEINYRPFDTRWTYYTGQSKGFYSSPCDHIMRNFLKTKNFGLVIGRQGQAVGSMPWNLIFIQNKISDINIFSRGGGKSLPLYTYPQKKNKDKQKEMKLGAADVVNMDEKIRKAIEDAATDAKHNKPEPIEIFDYIYGILHAPKYRDRYSEFLKDDFPYIPYPKTPAEFWYLSSIGTKLRELHLIPETIDGSAYTFDIEGDDKVKSPTFDSKNKKVFINDTQCFNNVPKSAWDFYIGGYQPAQKWLKDRQKSKKNPDAQPLEYKDITHYQRIIAVLVQTEQTMKTIKWSRP